MRLAFVKHETQNPHTFMLLRREDKSLCREESNDNSSQPTDRPPPPSGFPVSQPPSIQSSTNHTRDPQCIYSVPRYTLGRRWWCSTIFTVRPFRLPGTVPCFPFQLIQVSSIFGAESLYNERVIVVSFLETKRQPMEKSESQWLISLAPITAVPIQEPWCHHRHLAVPFLPYLR